MDFRLSDEQLALQETARRFAQSEIAPIAAQYDQSGEFPRDVIRMASDLVKLRRRGVGEVPRRPSA